MPQFPVIGYLLQVSTAPRPLPGGIAPTMTPRVSIQLEPNGQFRPLPINDATEFMAICALIQTEGRLVFDAEQETLDKVMP
jgi:hypothetical protein